MNYNLLIHELVDGTLDPVHEENLFYALTSNDDLRFELKQQIAMKNAIRSDIQAFSPSPESTLKIFNKLGFMPPVEPAPVPLPEPIIKTGLLQRLLTYKQGILSGIVSSIATLIIVLSLMNNGDNNQAGMASGNQSTAVKTETPLMSSYNNQQTGNATNIADNNNSNNTKSQSFNSVREKVITKYIHDTLRSNDSGNNKVQDENLADNSVKTQKPVQMSKSNIYYDNFPVFAGRSSDNGIGSLGTSNTSVDAFFKDITQVQPTALAGLSVELSGNQNWFLKNATINPKDFAKFNNASLGFLYDLNDKFTFGMEIRQENFFQTYTGRDANGNLYKYEQQPNFTSYGVLGRYRFGSLFSGFFPMMQLSIGGTNAGFIGRGMTGAEYEPYQGISFLLGFEYNELFFKHQGNSFNSSKIGLKYGLSFKF